MIRLREVACTATMRGTRTSRARQAVRIALIVIAAALSQSVSADMFSAALAYQKGDFEQAFKDFRELAELGQPTAQFNVAAMYAKGQGTRQSELNAYAWAMIAADNGEPRGKVLADELRPNLAPGSEKLAEDVRSRFGPPALTERLMPRALARPAEELEQRQRCRPVKDYMPTYPEDARREGIEGEVYVEFTLMPDGHARNSRILYAIPGEQFEKAVRATLLRADFVPGAAGGDPIQCTLFYRFTIAGANLQDYVGLKAFVAKTLAQAQDGDPKAQLIYGMMIAGLPQLNRPRSAALPWFLKAAQSGSPVAQFEVGYSLLKGWGCQCEENKALIWLGRAAATDEPDAQVALAAYSLRDRADSEGFKRAKIWLERAVAHGNRDGMLYLSALLAAAPDAGLRDAKRSLDLLGEVFAGDRNDPTAFEIRAAAQAGLGNFPGAVKSERTAINMARKIGWDVSALNERLSSYQGNQPWYGDLLGF